MKGLILSGGTGSRLRPLTYTSAKQLIPIANKPILFFGIEAMRDAGILDIGIIVGDTRAEIEAAVGDGAQWGVRIEIIPQSAPLGLAHAVLTAAPFLGTDSFMVYLGDNLIAGGVKEPVRAYEASGADAMVMLTRVPDPQRFGVVELRDGRVVRLVEKPKVPPSDLALVGIYLFNHRILEGCRAIKPSLRGELEITDAIQWLVDAGYHVEPRLVTGWWKDTGKPEDVLDANRLVLDTVERRVDGSVEGRSEVSGRVVVAEGARLVDVVVRGPAVIGKDAVVERSYIGPYTSIGAGALVRNAEVENSILLDQCVVDSPPGRLDSCIIGRGAKVLRAPPRPSASRLVIGDNSIVELE